MELDSHSWMGCPSTGAFCTLSEVKRREVELGSHSWMACPSTGAFCTLSEVKRREVELGSHSWMACLAAELSLNSCFWDTVRGQEEGGGAGVS